LRTNEETPVQELAKLFAKEIWRLHGLPSEIVSDRDAKFTSHLWKELMEHLDVKLSMSTAFHPQTDGQTERVNSVLEQYVRHYCSFQQDDWVDLLPMAEFAYNTAVSETTKMSPFQANYMFQPETQWIKPAEGQEWSNPASELLLTRWKRILEFLKENIYQAQTRMAKWHDAKAQSQPSFKVGDMVMIDARNIRTKRPSKKLDHKKIGPFPIIKLIGKRAVKVRLPPAMEMHPVYHVSMVEPYRESKLPGRHQSPPPPEEIDGEKYWVVDKIAKSRLNRQKKRVEYLVFWKGYPPEEATWEPWEHLEGDETVSRMLKEFHERYPRQARDSRMK
jgi:hypothetical protein